MAADLIPLPQGARWGSCLPLHLVVVDDFMNVLGIASSVVKIAAPVRVTGTVE